MHHTLEQYTRKQWKNILTISCSTGATPSWTEAFSTAESVSVSAVVPTSGSFAVFLSSPCSEQGAGTASSADTDC